MCIKIVENSPVALERHGRDAKGGAEPARGERVGKGANIGGQGALPVNCAPGAKGQPLAPDELGLAQAGRARGLAMAIEQARGAPGRKNARPLV